MKETFKNSKSKFRQEFGKITKFELAILYKIKIFAIFFKMDCYSTIKPKFEISIFNSKFETKLKILSAEAPTPEPPRMFEANFEF